MKYLPSKFNKVLIDNNELLLVNTLYGKKIKFDTKNIKDVIKSLTVEYIDESDNELFTYLKDNKYIVKISENEDFNAEMSRSDHVLNDRLTISIMPTEQCNFRCTYCYESFKHGKMSKNLQDAIIKFIGRNIIKYSSVDLSWYGGEPLLEKEVIEYISEEVMKICRKTKRYLTTSITTNAYYLDIETFKMLQKYNLVNVQVTLDGIKETHDKQRVLANKKPTFDVILKNLLNIKNNTKSAVQKIIIRTNVSQDIYNILDEYIDFYADTFGDDERFTFLIRPVGDWGGDAVGQMSDKLMNNDTFRLVYDKLINNPKKLNMSFIEGYLQPGGSVCYAARRNFYLFRANGEINKCTCVLDAEENHIGKILDSGKLEIDEAKMARWVAGYKLEKCNNCSFYGSCFAANCPMRVKATNAPHLCGYEKQYLDETMRLLNSCGLFERYGRDLYE